LLKRIMAIFAALTITLSGALALRPAPAAASWNDCPVNRMCVWMNTNYWGAMAIYYGPTDVCIESPQPNGTSSLRNRRYYVDIYDSPGCLGNNIFVWPEDSISPIPAPLHDRVRSYRLH
jgi:hypothetical protein